VKYYASNSLRLVLAGSVKTTLNGFKLRHKYWKQFKCRGNLGRSNPIKSEFLSNSDTIICWFFQPNLKSAGKSIKKKCGWSVKFTATVIGIIVFFLKFIIYYYKMAPDINSDFLIHFLLSFWFHQTNSVTWFSLQLCRLSFTHHFSWPCKGTAQFFTTGWCRDTEVQPLPSLNDAADHERRTMTPAISTFAWHVASSID
jgi:hypothetical protein